jgi:hypothetical protein
MSPADGQPELTVTEAARAVRVDPRTIRRRLGRGDFPNAHRDGGKEGPDTGPWLIPVTDLLGAGLPLHAPEPDEPTILRVESEAALRLALADAVRRAVVAEAIATERERIIEAQGIALRALMGGDPPFHTDLPLEPEWPADLPDASDEGSDEVLYAEEPLEPEWQSEDPPDPPKPPEQGSPTGVERRADPWWTVPSPPTPPYIPPKRHWWRRR